MSWTTALLSFAAVAGLLTLIPGLDTALVLRAALSQSRVNAFATAAGVSTGALLWGTGAAVGVSALLTASSQAYSVVRMVGAAYMLWLGGRMLWAAMRSPGSLDLGIAPPATGPWRCWTRGLLTNLLNPKIGAFYVAVLPQFIPAHANHLLAGLLLALVHDTEALVWFSAIIMAAGSARRWLNRRAARRGIDAATGLALVGFGVKLGASAH